MTMMMTQQAQDLEQITLENRLGQQVALGVRRVPMSSRDFLFIQALNSSPSSLVAKNAEHFAFQLVTRFGINPACLEMVELRDNSGKREWLRWRCQWVGKTPRDARCQVVTNIAQQEYFASVLGSEGREAQTASVAIAKPVAATTKPVAEVA